MKLSPEAEKIRDHGWKQFHLINIDTEMKSGIYILLNQNCDIQTHPLNVEPYIEIILCKSIEKPDGNFTKGKNPRKIHIAVSKGKDKHYFECEAKNKIIVDRGLLTKMKPYDEFQLSKKESGIFVRWILSRYDRADFPNSFNMRRNNKALKKIIQAEHEAIEQVLVRLNTEEELPSDMPYNIVLYLLIDETITDVCRLKISKVLEKLVSEFEKNGGIKVIDGNVLTLREISALEFFSMKALNFDDLSYPDD